MKTKIILATLIFGVISFSCIGQKSFTPGNLVVYRVGDGSAPLENITASVFLDEYTPAGVLVQSIAMPNAVSGANKPLTSLGAQSREGMLSLSANGRYLALTGYTSVPGTDAGTALSDIKVIGLVDFNGVVNTSNALNYDAQPVSAVTDNGTNFWIAGVGDISYAQSGSTSVTQISTVNPRNLNITGGQLYISTTSVIGKLGSELPKTSNQVLTGLPGLPTGRPYQFAFADLDPGVGGADVLYVADQGTLGLAKFSLVNGSWVSNGHIGDFNSGYLGMTIRITGNDVTIFATRFGPAFTPGGELVSLVDKSGYNGALTGTPNVLKTVVTPGKMAFRGVSLAPQMPPSCSLSRPQVSDISPSGVTVLWTAVPGVAGYEYAVSTSSTPPANGTYVATNSVKISGLTNGVTYYAHVRTNCGNSNYSEWRSLSFQTACHAPILASIAIINIKRDGTADVKWNTVFGASNYEYVLTTTSTPPVSGKAVSDTLFHATGLASVTKYYVYVRSDCGGGNFSPWTAKSFITDCFMPALNVEVIKDNAGASWNEVKNASGYEYALTSYEANPFSGNFTNKTSYILTDLAGGNGQYFHVRSICSTGAVSEWTTVKFNLPGLEAFPNPVKEVLTVSIYGISANTGQVTICDAMGKIVRKKEWSGGSINIDMRGLAAGIYIIKYADGKMKYTARVLKQ